MNEFPPKGKEGKKGKKTGECSKNIVPISSPSSSNWKPCMLGFPYPMPNLGLYEDEETELK